MSCKTTVLQELKEDRIAGNAAFVFFILRELASCGTTSLPDYRTLSEEHQLTEKAWRHSMKVLIQKGWVKTNSVRRKFTTVTILRHPLRGAEKGAEKGATISASIQPVPHSRGAEKGAEKGAPVDGLSGVKTFGLDVDVVDSGVKEALRKKDGDAANGAAELFLAGPAKMDPTPHLQFQETYNRLCTKLNKCAAMNDERKRTLRAAWKLRPDWRYWETVFDLANRTPFCYGMNDRNSTMGIDFILRRHVKITERAYGIPKPAPGAQRAPVVPVVVEPSAEERAEVLRMIAESRVGRPAQLAEAVG